MGTMEKWNQIKGYEGLYEVSNIGRIRSKDRYVDGKNGKRLIRGQNIIQEEHKGYMCIKLSKNNKGNWKKAHRLTAIAFNPIENDCEMDVNHIDGNKHNNAIENLEWCTREENLLHASRIGLNKQSIRIVAYNGSEAIHAYSIRDVYRKLSKKIKINCTEHTFSNNVRRALATSGEYYGYMYTKEVTS